MERAGNILKKSLSLVTGDSSESVLDVIRKEHREAASLLDDAVALEAGDPKSAALAKRIEIALSEHVAIEERLFYGPLRRRAEDADERVDMFEAYTEHEVVRHLIALLRSGRRRDERFKAELQVLAENVRHHVKEEESTVFSLARKLLDEGELERMGRAWRKAKSERMPARKAAARTTLARKPTPRKVASARSKNSGGKKR